VISPYSPERRIVVVEPIVRGGRPVVRSISKLISTGFKRRFPQIRNAVWTAVRAGSFSCRLGPKLMWKVGEVEGSVLRSTREIFAKYPSGRGRITFHLNISLPHSMSSVISEETIVKSRRKKREEKDIFFTQFCQF